MIYIASDHGGIELKKGAVEYLKSLNIDVLDLGANSNERTDYPIYAKKLADKMKEDKFTGKGILICKSGHGMTYAVNKFDNIRGSLAYSKESLENGIKDDGLNVMTIASNDTDINTMKEYIDVFLKTEFKNNEKYLERIKQVLEFEKENKNAK